ncbi:hypothetical protein QQS21_007123 [Conoideocrella luteorostrata]|uniref:Ubiquitin interaction domain-containing protein n=1 Tax=Conoideocrella luteorostrata TaxID=1105319 RepID=A0AAJ0CLD1_9HYPO|nr:hypothetical protein QQS21_007123 [Conoideocrella luteorostrata]
MFSITRRKDDVRYRPKGTGGATAGFSKAPKLPLLPLPLLSGTWAKSVQTSAELSSLGHLLALIQVQWWATIIRELIKYPTTFIAFYPSQTADFATVKVAKMASREPPSEFQISQVIDFAGLDPYEDRPMVIQALKDNGCNVEAVVMEYLDSSESFRQKHAQQWNESMFTADRDGTANNSGTSFHIESMTDTDVIQGVTPPPEPYGPIAPSRPPSRSNDKSPLCRMLDWVENETGADTSMSREDEDMQRALRESAQEAGIGLAGQQSGVTDASMSSAPSFGPANRTDYELGDWAMVPSGPSETRVPTAPAASLRKRSPDTPAFLIQGKSTVGKHGLGGLITVLHEIPLARNVFLQIGTPALSYGFNSEWWKGQEILSPQVLARLHSGELEWGKQDESKPDVEEEIHRLMAFLDSTERSYGTVSVLADLIPSSGLGPEKQLYEYIGSRNEVILQPLIHTVPLAPVLGDDLGQDGARFCLLEMDHHREDYTYIKTLYESLDHTMWSDALQQNEIHEGSNMAMFKEMGDVLAIKLGGDGPEDSIDIPEKLYLDKYQTTRKDEARRIQMAWCATRNAISRIAKEEMKLYEWRNNWNDRVFDRKQMIQRAQDQWRVYYEYVQSLSRFRQMEASGFDTDKYPDYRMAPCEIDAQDENKYQTVEDVLKLTERMLSDIDTRMKVLNEQLEQIKSKQRYLGRLLTQPNKADRPQPMTCKELLLRGVVTQSDTIYVCRRLERDLIELGDQPKELDQWWKLAYDSTKEQPVTTEQVDIELVLRDVWHETKVPVLIYATEAALTAPRTPLTVPLQRFARAENKVFHQELNQELDQETTEIGDSKKVTGLIDPISPSKRKHRADSIDSMNSNRASLGSDDGQNGFDNPFIDSQPTTATMTPSGTPAAAIPATDSAPADSTINVRVQSPNVVISSQGKETALANERPANA